MAARTEDEVRSEVKLKGYGVVGGGGYRTEVSHRLKGWKAMLSMSFWIEADRKLGAGIVDQRLELERNGRGP